MERLPGFTRPIFTELTDEKLGCRLAEQVLAEPRS